MRYAEVDFMFTRFLRWFEIMEDESGWWLFWFLFVFLSLVFRFRVQLILLANVFLYIALMSKSHDLFAEDAFPLSRAYMVFLVSSDSNATFVTVVHQLTDWFLLSRLDSFMIVKAGLTSECSLAILTIDFPSSSRKNIVVAAIASIWTSMSPSTGVPYIAILT